MGGGISGGIGGLAGERWRMGRRVAVSELWAAEMLKERVEEHVHLYFTLNAMEGDIGIAIAYQFGCDDFLLSRGRGDGASSSTYGYGHYSPLAGLVWAYATSARVLVQL
ncbi:hypothetical protein O988_06803 [Pseudogymnoascus sp. VKM F-3808]|nr:hypothetical protein O988_06803 [Pseudogymnoascus sp. VKM F-3808]